ncbi:MAG: hypothetical protein MUF85_00710 [Patescibacteria group bacterium]|jgi:hypothetical protein|nr:hypothetical protein [Patescibacteria group bacterium]
MKKLSYKDESIQIKKPLQMLILGGTIISFLIPIILTIGNLRYYVGDNNEGILTAYGWIFAMSLMPIIMFLIAFYVFKNNRTYLQRGFVASLWYFIGYTLYNLSITASSVGIIFNILSATNGVLIYPAVLLVYIALIVVWKLKYEK